LFPNKVALVTEPICPEGTKEQHPDNIAVMGKAWTTRKSLANRANAVDITRPLGPIPMYANA
jgi:hypothetical protein